MSTPNLNKPTMNLPGMDKAHTFTLSKPIVRDNGSTIATLTLRKPVAGELRGLAIKDLVVGDVDSVIALVPRIAMPAILPEHAAAFESEDIAEAAGVISAFLTNRAPTTTTEAA